MAGQTACRLPVGLTEISRQRAALQTPILLELTRQVPAGIPKSLEQCLRRIPRIKQHKLRPTSEPIAGVAQQLQGKIELGWSPFVPDPKGQGNTALSIRPHQQHHGDAKDDLRVFARPDPGRRCRTQPHRLEVCPQLLELADSGFDSTVLRECRSRLVAGAAEQRVLDAFLDACRERKCSRLGGVNGPTQPVSLPVSVPST